MNRIELTAEENGIRIDKYLSDKTELSRSRIQALCEEGKILADGKPAKASLKLSEGMRIEAEIPDDEPMDVIAENIPLDILATEQGAGYGGAMLAMVGCGAYDSVEHCADHLICVTDTVYPDADIAARYEQQYRHFGQIYPTCRTLFAELRK